ncbi:HNH endonuclease [Porcincola intestinalis]|uniref:HNH endonuclease n=1 Tax=Porcincola intestinalis TaxID=2606632 RepID=UPI002A81D00A|nr:hypothetical protein [Porcincola intestinalis]MDY4205530.1 hypothetical protein [Porcincola intestinalis]
MTQAELATWIRQLIKEDRLYKFYKSKDWIKLKTEILRDAHYECAVCRQHGKITRYDVDLMTGEKKLISTVHHVMHVREHPELAMSRTFRDPATGEIKTNLLPVCKSCHNKLHPEKFKSKQKQAKPLTVERW